MSMSAYVVFRGKTFKLQLEAANDVSTEKRFLNLIGAECEISAQQLAKHAVFVDENESIIDASAPYQSWAEKTIYMHLSQVCSVCQIDQNDIGTEYNGAIFTMFCGHTLHRDCFEKMTNKSCPLCRNSLLEVQRQHEEKQVQQQVQQQVQRSASYLYFMVPKWSVTDGNGYRIENNQQVAHPTGHGMLILHSEPLTDGQQYRFCLIAGEQGYCTSALLLEKQSPSNRNFGSDFRICEPLNDNIGKQTVYFDVDMRARVAKYHFGDRDSIKTITDLPTTVYVACAVKHEKITICPLLEF